MSKTELETIDHLLLHCPFSRNLWSSAWWCLGLHWVVSSTMKHQLLACEGFFLGRKAKYRVFRFIPHAIFFILWMERNRRVSDGVKTSLERTSGLRFYFLEGGLLFLFNLYNRFCG